MDLDSPTFQEDEAVLTGGARSLGIELTENQLAQFRTYACTLLEWNRRVNLTAITDYREIVAKHFLDSLTVLLGMRLLHHGAVERGCPSPEAGPLSLLDVGTGAGFPGMPLRIACPTMRLTLLDSSAKKTDFLRHLLALLQIDDVGVTTARAEEIARRQEHRESYQLTVSRAVGNLTTLAEYLLPFCALGGLAIAMKKGTMAAETASAQRAIALLGGRLRETIPVWLPGLADDRCLVVMEKVGPTPEGYPRRTGIPAKRPL